MEVDTLYTPSINGNKGLKPLAATTIGVEFGPKDTFQTSSQKHLWA
jgi:hypothetical protein